MAAALAVSAVAMAAQEAINLKRTPKDGEASVYRLKADIDLAGTQATFTAKISEKVTKVEGDNYTVETAITEGKALFGGQEMPMEDQPATSATYKTTGEIVSMSETDPGAMRMANLQSFRYPTGPVKVGDTWNTEVAASDKTGGVGMKAEFKVDGMEKVGAWETARIKFTVKETSGAEPASSEGTAWIAVTDGSLVKYEGSWANAPFPGAPGPINAKVTITRE